MAFSLGLLSGLMLGIIYGTCAWVNAEKKAVKRGIITIEDSVYKLTRIEIWDVDKYESWRKTQKCADEEGKL